MLACPIYQRCAALLDPGHKVCKQSLIAFWNIITKLLPNGLQGLKLGLKLEILHPKQQAVIVLISSETTK